MDDTSVGIGGGVDVVDVVVELSWLCYVVFVALVC